MIRLFPVPFRLISDDQQFRKWQWVTVLLEKARDDHRPESHRIFVDQLQCDPEVMKSGRDGWPKRMEYLSRLIIHSNFESIEAARIESGLTLAFLRPKKILKLEITPTANATWTEEEKRKLLQLQRQAGLFEVEETKKQTRLLEKVPFDFYYHYECEVDGKSISRKIKIVDWEAGALYRRLRNEFGITGWEQPFRNKYEQELPARDLLLLLGTIHRFPNQWLAISVICPPKQLSEDPNQGSLF